MPVPRPRLCGLWRPNAISLALLVASFAVPSAIQAQTPAGLPALSPSGTQSYHPGSFVWHDLFTADPLAARAFYTSVFGWEAMDIRVGEIDYTVFSIRGTPVAGMLERKDPDGGDRGGLWVGYLSVPDVDAATALLSTNERSVLAAPNSVEARGRHAIVAEADGAILGLLRSSSGDPEPGPVQPGEWIWSQRFARQPAAVALRYSEELPFSLEPVRISDNAHAYFLKADGNARAAVAPMPAATPNAQPQWIHFVQIEEMSETLAAIQAAGGRVLLPPSPDRLDGRVAIVADPAGAHLGLMDWDDLVGGDANADTEVQP